MLQEQSLGPAITVSNVSSSPTMRNSPLALLLAMGTLLVATSFSLLVLMPLAVGAFAVTQIVAAAAVALVGTAALYLAARLRHVSRKQRI